MHLKSDSRGITLIELIVAISLLTVVLSSAYFLLFFSTNSLNDTEAQFIAEQDARMAVISMEDDIRKAQPVNYGGSYHKAVEVMASGMQLYVYTDTNNDGVLEMVRYKLEDNKLKRGEASLGVVPTVWCTIVNRVKNNMITPSVSIFSISSKVIKINLMVIDEKDRLIDHPVSVKTSITVRSKGAMD